MVQPINESTHDELLALTPSGDLMDLARRLRQQGVECILICRPHGQIVQVVTDRQIAQLASADTRAMTQFATPSDGQAHEGAPHEPITVPESRRPRDDLVRQESGAGRSGDPNVKE
jgi:hypothetical protein